MLQQKRRCCFAQRRSEGLRAFAQSLSTAGLDRGIPERPQYGIDFGLVARPLCLEPLKDISIHTKRNRRLRRERLQSTPDNPSNDMF